MSETLTQTSVPQPTPEVTQSVTESIPTTAVASSATPTPAPVPADWRSSIDEDLRGAKCLQDYKDINSLIKSHVHLNSMIGKRVADMSPEDAEVLKGLYGRPKDAQGYSIPEGAAPEVADWYKKTAFELGLSTEQALKLSQSFMDLEKSAMERMSVQHRQQEEELQATLQKEFGSALDKRVAVARKAVDAYGGAELKDYLNQTGLGNHPAMIKAFEKIGMELLEHQTPGVKGSTDLGLTPSEARNRANLILNNPELRKKAFDASIPKDRNPVFLELEEYYRAMAG